MTTNNDLLKRTSVTVERVTLRSDRAFDDVLDGIYRGISRPDIAVASHNWTTASSYAEFEKAVSEVAGPAGLMQFFRLDQDAALAKIPDVAPYRLVRIIAGNPLT